MENLNPIDRLYIIAEQVRCAGDQENFDWMMRAIDKHVRTGASLDESLALKGKSPERSQRWRIIDRQQAMLIRDALWLCDGNKAELARQIKQYKLRKQAIYANKEAPADWPELTKLIHAACRLKEVQATPQGIHYLLRRN
jgi:hypothetical protein